MCGLIAADAWLLSLAERGGPYKRVAGILLRSQILHSNRTGHLIDLSTQQVRRAIVSSARYGYVARQQARCVNCGCLAPLTWWVKVHDWTAPELEAKQRECAAHRRAHEFTFLQRCAGPGFALAMLEATALENGEGV